MENLIKTNSDSYENNFNNKNAKQTFNINNSKPKINLSNSKPNNYNNRKVIEKNQYFNNNNNNINIKVNCLIENKINNSFDEKTNSIITNKITDIEDIKSDINNFKNSFNENGYDANYIKSLMEDYINHINSNQIENATKNNKKPNDKILKFV